MRNNQANDPDYKTLIVAMIHGMDSSSDKRFLRQIYTILRRHMMKLSAQADSPGNDSIA